ncbi:O-FUCOSYLTRANSFERASE 10-RELATED [Salix koriyanagi]|uniref:O-fucosyltransferase family protein n=2 Tax=Salix koriyanagi TaxID=2511006 RepID=A0A9Q0P4Y3_9ROSI|nr:O-FUCOSYLTRANSFERASE 10-RELATED [Salix koriyanagi]
MAINTSMKNKPYNAVSSEGDGNSPSSPPSPRRQTSGFSQCRRRLRSKVPLQYFPKYSLAAGIFFRRNIQYLLLLFFLYFSGLMMCVGRFSNFLLHSREPIAIYKSHLLLEKFWHDIETDNSTALELSSVWQLKRRMKVHKPCPVPTVRRHLSSVEVSSGPTGYLIVEANGGLNQQRSAICNAVAVAGILNAVLVIPSFDYNSVWKDPSEFRDIYDEDHFIATLEGYVKVVKELPNELLSRYDHNITNIPHLRVEAWAPAKHYLGKVYPVLQEQGVVRIAPFANRLAMDVPSHIQLLRCITNYRALRFSSPISTLAQKLQNRMIERSSMTGGKYVSVHLRFEEDMVAFSCCLYDGGDAEKFEMDSFREKGWKGKFKKKDFDFVAGRNRIDGKCPLTPLEVGMMLRAMGFDNNTSIYLASGKLYKAEQNLAPLLKMFPLLYTKESLATSDELAPFQGYSSRLAALDYTVCLFSEVFVTTQGGNFPHFLMGHRRFLYNGHAKTIKPDKRMFVSLLENMTIRYSFPSTASFLFVNILVLLGTAMLRVLDLHAASIFDNLLMTG